MNSLFTTADQMQRELGSIIAEVNRYLNVAKATKEVDVGQLDMKKVKVPAGVYERVKSVDV